MDLTGLPLFSEAAPSQKIPHWTVTELTSRIRGILEPQLTQVWVQGEVSNYRPATSGHAYFSLKDAGASISAAIFGWGAKNAKRKESFELKDGLQILCRGKVSVYPPRGSYQLVIDHIEPLGAGALQIAFEKLKARLAAEGLFDSSRKKSLPHFPNRIVVITSPSGAAIRDMLNILNRRAPHIRVIIVPAVVQGDEAPRQLIRGLEIAQQFELGDIMVLARGGGSIEDLWCFNDEGLARAIAQCRIPVISAIGHEIDFTISDFVADLRAPTPSAAAELVSGYWVDALRQLRDDRVRLYQGILRDLSTRKTLLTHIVARVINPRDRLREQAQKCDELSLRLERAMRVRLEKRQAILGQWVGKLDALSPLRVLERGYSMVRDPHRGDQLIKSAHEIQKGQELRILFHDGQRSVQAL